ncbi:hypothetical protein CAEBREN_05478 [Caenorhabditis brenneri]|uniref:Uncharacterized protein n=1 Tax=Caenorhabditis brenneri TaxID=135651 RepID=G0MKH9_CAEBE|nr:hypothetical protein CAEBREN_05478 [Caenorhabditis brenneri]
MTVVIDASNRSAKKTCETVEKQLQLMEKHMMTMEKLMQVTEKNAEIPLPQSVIPQSCNTISPFVTPPMNMLPPIYQHYSQISEQQRPPISLQFKNSSRFDRDRNGIIVSNEMFFLKCTVFTYRSYDASSAVIFTISTTVSIAPL